MVSVQARNAIAETVRIEQVRAAFVRGAGEASSRPLSTELLAASGDEASARLEAGAVARWQALCLPVPPGEIRSLRIEFDLVVGRGRAKRKSTQAVEVALSDLRAPPVLDLPVRGAWRISQGHACGSQHRSGRLGGEFAWDLAAVDATAASLRQREQPPLRNEGSPSFGREVIAPVAGRVVSVVDGVADRDAEQEFPRKSIVETALAPRWIFGNHLVLDAGGGVYVLLAHLKNGSIVRRVGDTVAAGEVLARVGNSGNTILPHLHVQVMDGADPADPAVSGVPARFRDYVEVTASRDGNASDASVRSVAAGDPAEGAVVVRVDSAPTGRP